MLRKRTHKKKGQHTNQLILNQFVNFILFLKLKYKEDTVLKQIHNNKIK